MRVDGIAEGKLAWLGLSPSTLTLLCSFHLHSLPRLFLLHATVGAQGVRLSKLRGGSELADILGSMLTWTLDSNSRRKVHDFLTWAVALTFAV